MDHRPQLPHRGSSQISDLDVEFDVDCPPTPVLEGKHMARRELPLDLEKCQEKNDLECETHDVPTQGYKSHPYPSLTPPAWAGLRPSPANTKNFVTVATLYLCLQIFFWRFICAAALAGAGSFEARTGVDSDEEELEIVIPWWYVVAIFALVTATSRLTTWGAKLVMSRFGRPTSGVWFSIYDNSAPAIAMAVCWFVHLI